MDGPWPIPVAILCLLCLVASTSIAMGVAASQPTVTAADSHNSTANVNEVSERALPNVKPRAMGAALQTNADASSEIDEADTTECVTTGVVRSPEPLPTNGDLEFPVILVNFTDTAPTYDPEDFEKLLFQEDPAIATGPGSLQDYYEEVSNGQFHVNGTVVDWVTANHSHDYYGRNDFQGDDRNASDLVKEAVKKADADVNFSEYDANNDGYVDGVIVVHQGTGEAFSAGGNTDIHSHQSTFEKQFGDFAETDDGACVNSYTIQPETLDDGFDPSIMTIGVFAHEMGHLLGLPDLYDTDDSSDGIGYWGLMGNGDSLKVTNTGDSPAHLSAWSKWRLDWIEPTKIPGTNERTLSPVETSQTVFQLLDNPNGPDDWDPNPENPDFRGDGEYFLLENRQQTGFDKGLPGEGMLIWHIDESRTDNNDEAHKLVDVEAADANGDLDFNPHLGDNNVGDDGDPYPGSADNRRFGPTSDPNSTLYDGNDSGVDIREIWETGKNISFNEPPEVTANPSEYEQIQDWAFVGDKITVNVTAIDDRSGVKNVSVNVSSISTRGEVELKNSGGYWIGTVTVDKAVKGTFELPVVAHDQYDIVNDTETVSVRVVENTTIDGSEVRNRSFQCDLRKIHEPGYYVFRGDLQETCVVVNSSDVVVDGAGGNVSNVRVFPPSELEQVSGITVKNLRIVGFDVQSWGVIFEGVAGGRITNLTVDPASGNMIDTGIAVRPEAFAGKSEDVVIDGNTVRETNTGIWTRHVNAEIKHNTIIGKDGLTVSTGIDASVNGTSLLVAKNTVRKASLSVSPEVPSNAPVSEVKIAENDVIGGLIEVQIINTTLSTPRASDGPYNISIVNNEQASGSTGIFVDGSNITVRNNTAIRNDDSGITSQGDNLIVANNASSNQQWGIRTSPQDRSNTTIVGNIILNNTEHGILLTDGNNTVRNNTVSSNGKYGISALSSDHNQIIDNSVRNNANAGIFVSFRVILPFDGYSDHNRVQDNNVSGNDGIGIALEAVNETVVVNNTVIGNEGVGVFLNGSSHNSVRNNTVAQNRERGIALTDKNFSQLSWLFPAGTQIRNATVDNRIENNTVRANDRSGIYLNHTAATTVHANDIANNANGIRLFSPSTIELTNNSISNNTMGIAIPTRENSTPLDILDNRIVENDIGIVFGGGPISGKLILRGVEIHDNLIARNSHYGIRNDNTTAGTHVDARRNDWGLAHGAQKPGTNIRVANASPVLDPVTTLPANGTGDNVTEGSPVGRANVRFDPVVEVSSNGDTTAPTITNTNVTDIVDGDDIVSDGDNVSISADVADSGSGVDTVNANASAFGAGKVTLNDSDGDGLYHATFAVDAGNVSSLGSHVIEISAKDTGGNVATVNTSMLRLVSCIADSVSGSNDEISLTEIQNAINWWAEGSEVPDTGGETINLSKIQSLINAWAEDSTVSCS